MKRTLLTIVLLAFAASAYAQAPAEVDVIGQQAATLEAELGKYKDSAPEAAEAMVKLVDLYHQDGRLFGLVRIAQQFVGAHPTDPRHKAVMLKLIDGQEALSRNKELSATIRQFLARYTTAPECAALEVRLADSLIQLGDKPRAAEACRAVWTRQGTAEAGRRFGAIAVQLYSGLNNADGFKQSAELAEQMLDKLPAGEFAKELGHHAFHEYRRLSQWAKSTAVGTKLLQKNLAGDPDLQRALHVSMAENHANLGQFANSAASLKASRALKDGQWVHYQLITRLAQAAAKPNELEPLVLEYGQKYPQRADRFHGLSYLASSCLANGEKAKAVQLWSQLLVPDPAFNGNASAFVRENGAEPAQLADSEAKLRAAIAQGKPGVAYLRYVLAFDLLRDRVKDNAKAKAVLRELIAQSPTDDGYTSAAVEWLLYNPTDDNEFKSDLALILESRKKHPHLGNFYGFVRTWWQTARQNKQLADRAKLANEEWTKTSADPLLTTFADLRAATAAQAEGIRNTLLLPATFDKFSDATARSLLQTQSDYYRHYANPNKRGENVRVYAQYAKRFPTEYQPAAWWLEAATDYGKPEDCKAAAEHFLKFPPENSSGDTWRRLLLCADKNGPDANLARATWNYLTAAQQKFGPEPTYAAGIGDSLLKMKMETEAVAHWTMYVTANRQHYESRECASRLLAREKDAPKRLAMLQDLVKPETDMHGRFAQWMADEYFKANDLANFERVLKEARTRQNERPLRTADFDIWPINGWVDAVRADTMRKDPEKARILTIIRDVQVYPPSAGAALTLLENAPVDPKAKMPRLLELQKFTRLVGNEWPDWDRLAPFAQTAVGKKDYVAAAVLSTGMLSNIPNVDEPRKKAIRDLVTASLARMGGVGLTIDDSSPLAPLMQAALYFRLGDERLAFDTYLANKRLFDENRNQLPPDLLSFVCERMMTAGGDANHDYVEEVLRGWLVAHSESKQHDDPTKARMQLLLAKNFFKAQRYDVARSEFTTVVNRYPSTIGAIEAEFGIGETFLAQKVYDQAEQVFEKLARSAEIDVVVRAEFLRGVLAFRRGDRDEARDIFKSVLERVPNVELANQALYNLAEVYGSEERYIDQLNLLRTVGRLGRASKRRHTPGVPLSIVVHDSDLGISRGHNRIPVRVTTEPGGDSELIYLVGSGAGKGLFRADVETRLGQAVPNDHVLQLTGNDTIKSDYPDEFKAEFKSVPLSDVEIKVAADAKFEVASSKIEDIQQESFSQTLARENGEEGDQRVSQDRPANQIKPGNLIYLRVKDADRDLTNDADKVVVKLTAESGDQIQVPLMETGPHTGLFEATAQTGELPAGALASDTAIDHSPLMAIDRDPKTSWMSEPDGATPKTLAIDMKDLKTVSRVKFVTPDAAKYAPVRGDLFGSHDGQFWFRIASIPERPVAAKLAAEYGQMTRRVFNGNFGDYTAWDSVVALSKNGKELEAVPADTLIYQRPADSEDAAKAYGVIWQGKFVQPKSGAVRIAVQGLKTALSIDGNVELPIGPSNRSVDLWLEAGAHDLAIFAANNNGQQPVQATLARANLSSADIDLLPFRATDFDLTHPVAQKPAAADPVAAAAASIPLVIASAQINKKTEAFAVTKMGTTDIISSWLAPEDSLAWEFEVPAPGVYEVWFDLSHEGDGGKFNLAIAGKNLEGRVPNTGNWATYRETRVGLVAIDAAGKQTLAVKPIEIVGAGLMNLKGVSLKRAVGASVLTTPTEWEFRFPTHELRHVRLVAHEYLGEALAISNVEIAGAGMLGDKADQQYIPTQEDVLSLAANQTLEIAAGDQITATYTDEATMNELSGSQLLDGKLQATYFNARIEPIAYDFVRNQNGQVGTFRKQLKRIDPGERITVEVTDYDADATAERDTIKFQVVVNDGAPLELVATETEAYTGIFTKEVDTAAMADKDKLVLKPGDRVTIRYYDAHNTFPGHSVPREEMVYVAQPTEGLVRVLETRIVPPPKDSKALPQTVILPPKKGQETSGIAFEAPITIEVIDPDAAKDSRSTAVVKLTTTDGATVEVECLVSAQYSDIAGDSAERQALEEGRFIGQVILQLGGKSSPAVVPLTTDMPRNLIGKVRLGDEAGVDNTGANLVTRVLNLTGKDIVTAAYSDERRPDGKPAALSAKGRLISNGLLAITDRDYDKDVTQLHVGERLYLRVIDPDLDSSDTRDSATVEIATELGDKELVKLEETLTHSGIFTGSLQLKAVDKPTPGNLDLAEPAIESYFGDNISVRYVDPAASTENGTLELVATLPVVVGTDGLVAAFSKTFNDENLAVETKFRIAESFFELFKSHKTLQRDDEKRTDLEAGRRVLREVIEDYPDPKYAPRIAYLLGQFAQELEQWDEAIRSYDMILRQYPDHTLAPDAQYKLAQCYEEAGDFDEALEAYVTLAATHPKSPLIPNVMIRISDYFYKNEKFEVAAQVGEKFLERFESHQHAPKMAFRIGQCFFKAKKYDAAGKSFDKFSEIFPKDTLTADAAFWAGESYRMGGNNRQAFISYNNCRWKHPDSEAAKYSRGRLALPEMLQQFEAEANSVDNDNN